MQRVERHVFFEIVRKVAQIFHHALCLLLQRQQICRQQSAQAQRVALLLVKAVPLLSSRIAQQRHAMRKTKIFSGLTELLDRAR